MTAAKLATPHPVQALYRDHHGWLESWLRKKLGGSPHAADIAQDTFVRLLTRTADAPSAAVPKEPRAYLTAIAKRLMIDHWRREAVEQAYLDALRVLPEAVEPSPECRALVLEALDEVAAMLARLSEKARRAFLMAQIEGCTDREIAAVLGVSDRMVRKYLAQAMYECLLLDALSALGGGRQG